MPLLFGRIGEREAWLSALDSWDNGDKDEVIDRITRADELNQLQHCVSLRDDVVKRLIDVLGVWLPVDYYRSLPVIYPYIVRDPHCRQNRRTGRPEEYCSPNEQGFMRADNTPIKQIVEGRQVVSPFAWYGGPMRRGFVASHAWREPENFTQNHVLASRDPWLNTFVPNLCWLPSALSRLTDHEGSFAQHYLQAVARSTYGAVQFENEELQVFVNRIWDRLPSPTELADVEVPNLEYRGQFQMRADDAQIKVCALRTVVTGLRDALNDHIPNRAVIHHRYTLRNLRQQVSPERLTELHNDLSNYLAMLNGDGGEIELRQNYHAIQEGWRRAVRESGLGGGMDRQTDVEIVLNPADQVEFKQLLLQTRRARRTRVFADGRPSKVDLWRADSFIANSNLMGNIKSSAAFRNAARDGVTRLEFEIVNN